MAAWKHRTDDLTNETVRRALMVKALFNAPKRMIKAARIFFMQVHAHKGINVLPSADISGKFSYARNPEADSDNRRIVTTFQRVARRQMGITQEMMSDNVLRDLGQHMSGFMRLQVANVQTADGNDEWGYNCSPIQDVYYRSPEPSCMRGDCSMYTVIYDANPDKVQILYVDDEEADGEDGSVLAKALLWTADNGEMYLERVYSEGSEDSVQAGHDIIAYARSLGANTQENNYYCAWNPSSLRGVEISMNPPREIDGHYYLPYADSFNCAKWRDGKIVLTAEGEAHAHLGSVSGLGITHCPECEEGLVLYKGEPRSTHESKCSHCEYVGSPRGPSCFNCANTLAGEDGHTFDDRSYCTSCFNTVIQQCVICGDTHRTRHSVMTASDGYQPACNSCFSALTVEHMCQRCENYSETPEVLRMVNRGRSRGTLRTCPECLGYIGAIECSECGEWHSVSTRSLEGRTYCRECYQQFQDECLDCGEVHDTTNLDDNQLCIVCASQEQVALEEWEQDFALSEERSIVRDHQTIQRAQEIMRLDHEATISDPATFGAADFGVTQWLSGMRGMREVTLQDSPWAHYMYGHAPQEMTLQVDTEEVRIAGTAEEEVE